MASGVCALFRKAFLHYKIIKFKKKCSHSIIKFSPTLCIFEPQSISNLFWQDVWNGSDVTFSSDSDPVVSQYLLINPHIFTFGSHQYSTGNRWDHTGVYYRARRGPRPESWKNPNKSTYVWGRWANKRNWEGTPRETESQDPRDSGSKWKGDAQ